MSVKITYINKAYECWFIPRKSFLSGKTTQQLIVIDTGELPF